MAEPADDPTPGELAQVSEGRRGHAVPEVVGPPPNSQSELLQDVGERVIRSLPCDLAHSGFDGGKCLLRRPRVRESLTLRAAPDLPLDAPAKELEALVEEGTCLHQSQSARD